MNLAGIPMELDSRSCDKAGMNGYEKMVVEQGYRMEQKLKVWLYSREENADERL